MTRKSQSQRSGNQSTNTQIDTQNNYGLSYEEVRQTALDVFKANFYALHKEAKEIAEARARKITEDILDEAFENKEHLIGNFSDPDIASALVEAQKIYAKSGDNSAESVLVSLILKRLETTERTEANILINEAIRKTELLTKDHLVFLHVFWRSVSINMNRSNPIKMAQFLSEQYQEFAHLVPTTEIKAKRDFLEYAGLLSVRAGGRPKLVSVLKRFFGYMFTKGINLEELGTANLTQLQRGTLWFPYGPVGDFSRVALPKHEAHLRDFMIKNGWGEKEADRLLKLNKASEMNETEIRNFLAEYFPNLDLYLSFRENPELMNCEVTPLGKIIASHVNPL
jgi:hypothetical protein